jgi:hypothetical protein
MAIWHIFGNLVYCKFGKLYQEKSGNPGNEVSAERGENQQVSAAV